MTDPSIWEDQAVSALQAAGLPELADFQIEALNNQVDFSKDELVIAAPYILVAWVAAAHDQGYIGADPLTLAFVAVVPGVNMRERRSRAVNAVVAIANWMRTGTTYQPDRSAIERVHPAAVASLTSTIVG